MVRSSFLVFSFSLFSLISDILLPHLLGGGMVVMTGGQSGPSGGNGSQPPSGPSGGNGGGDPQPPKETSHAHDDNRSRTERKEKRELPGSQGYFKYPCRYRMTHDCKE